MKNIIFSFFLLVLACSGFSQTQQSIPAQYQVVIPETGATVTFTQNFLGNWMVAFKTVDGKSHCCGLGPHCGHPWKWMIHREDGVPYYTQSCSDAGLVVGIHRITVSPEAVIKVVPHPWHN